jgi:hypothetical protein
MQLKAVTNDQTVIEGEYITTSVVSSVILKNKANLKNAEFWDIKTQFVPHRRHITSPLQSAAG